MNSVGILSAGGLGRVLAHWIVAGRPDVDVTGINVDRLPRYQLEPAYRRDAHDRDPRHGLRRATPGQVAAHRPRREASRRCTTGSSRSGALLPRRRGWEGADWFAGRRASTRSRRADVGPGALVRAVGGRAPRRPRGRRADGHVVHGEVPRAGRRRRARCSTTCRPTDVDGERGLHHLHASGSTTTAGSRPTSPSPSSPTTGSGGRLRHRPRARRGAGCAGTPATPTRSSPTSPSGYAQLNVQGPLSRELLARSPSADLSNEAFPFRGVREIDVGLRPVLCASGSPTSASSATSCTSRPSRRRTLYDAHVAAGEPLGLRHVGLKALASLRMEKAYRDYGHDIDNTDCSLDVGPRLRRRVGQPSFPARRGRWRRRRAGPLDPAAGAGPARRPRAAAVPRRAGAARRRGRRATSAPRRTAGRSAAPSGWRWSRPAEPVTRPGSTPATGRSTSPGGGYAGDVSLRPMYDPKNLRIHA